jgi:CRP-like cAMP-binding protein
MSKNQDSTLLFEGRELLKKLFQEIGILNDYEIKEVLQLTSYTSLSKGSYFITEGKICHDLVFTINGMLRSYFTKDDGEEVTYCFTFPHNLMTAYSSFITGDPTPENIQALIKTQLLVIRKDDITKLKDSSLNWIILEKFFAEQQYIALEERIFSYQKEKAKQRYRDLVKKQPQLLQEVSLQHLATYLNITPRHLSRIRKEVD